MAATDLDNKMLIINKLLKYRNETAHLIIHAKFFRCCIESNTCCSLLSIFFRRKSVQFKRRVFGTQCGIPSANNILGSISNLKGVSTGGSKDSDVLFEFIQSQQMVEYIDARINLRHIYTKPSNDPIFSFSDDGSIEDLLDYWGHMVKIYYDSGTGLIELRVNAFTAQGRPNCCTRNI
jgi:hypothetical protein